LRMLPKKPLKFNGLLVSWIENESTNETL
jgi:hypothetical protein